MRFSFRVLIATFIVIGLQTITRADEAGNAPDAVGARLDDAKSVNAKARQQAAAALRAACDEAIKSAKSGNQADLAAQVKAQEDAFSATGAVPSLPALKLAVDGYREATHLADANLERAFSRAVRHYSAGGDGAKALAIAHEKSSMLRRNSSEDVPAAPADAADPAAAEQALAQAKGQYRTDVNNARQTLLAKVDVRLNDAANAGDLQAARALQTIETAIKAGGPLPETVADPAVTTAGTNYRRAIQSANMRMARAFSESVRNFTRARKLDQAEGVQAEFVATGLSSIDLTAPQADNAVANDTTYVLGRHLPDFLAAGDRWNIRDRGISLQRRSFIRSKSGDYLDRDFTCDFWFTTETTGTYIFIGVGDGRGRQIDGVPRNSLALSVLSPDNGNGAVGFLRADGEIDAVGQLHAAGDYVARLQKVGNVLSLSIGEEDADGTFNPRVSTTVSDARVLAPFMTAHNAHLFFGGGRFWKLRYINGKPPAVVPDGVVKSLVGA